MRSALGPIAGLGGIAKVSTQCFGLKERGQRWLIVVTLTLSLVASYLPVPALAAGGESDLPPGAPVSERSDELDDPNEVWGWQGRRGAVYMMGRAEIPEASPASVGIMSVGEILVDSFEDAADPIPEDGICSSPKGCTLRAAIQTANSSPRFNRIILPAGEYRLAIAGRREDHAVKGDLDIWNSLTIVGSGGDKEGNPAETVIDGGGLDRVFQIYGFGGAHVTFQAITIRNGHAAADFTDTGYGGGLEFVTGAGKGSLTLYNVVVAENQAVAGGGGIEVYNITQGMGTTVVIDKSTIRDNKGLTGGGVEIGEANLTIRDSTFARNEAIGDHSGGGLAVAVASVGAETAAHIVRSLFHMNKAGTHGGGIAANAAKISVESSTFHGNAAGHTGGAIAFTAPNMAGTFTNLTVTANQAAQGGGLGSVHAADNHLAATVLRNSIVHGNVAPQGAEIFGTLQISQSYCNLVGSSGTGGLTQGAYGNLVGVDPKLSTLDDWGGPTMSQKPLPGSPAIDAGCKAFAASLDQRGFSRIAASAGSVGAAEVDIGAVEAHPTISVIGDQTGYVDLPIQVAFYVDDVAKGVTLTATSDNPSVVDEAGLTFLNAASRNPTVSIVGKGVGRARITVTASAGGDSLATEFHVDLQPSPRRSGRIRMR